MQNRLSSAIEDFWEGFNVDLPELGKPRSAFRIVDVYPSGMLARGAWRANVKLVVQVGETS